MTFKRILITLFISCSTITVLAADVTSAMVTHVNGVYKVSFEVSINADPQRVLYVVTDYDNLHELSGTVVSSKVLARDGGRTRLDLVLRPCVWRIFCRTIRKVTDATVAQDGGILHRTIASESDFSFAEEHLTIHAGPEHQGTWARYDAELVPKFFVPPLIGPWLVRRHIINDLTETATAVERVAGRPAK